MDSPTETVPALQTVRESLACASCSYDLRGLPIEGVCPECATEIEASLAAARLTALGRLRAPPSWLRIARSAYFAAWGTCIVSPGVLPLIGREFGMTNYFAFPNTLAACSALTLLVGWMIVAAFSASKCRGGNTVAVTAIMLIVFLMVMPAIGS